MKHIEGNLITLALAGQFDVIVHGCNCFCTMGRGIAQPIKEAFPQAYAADRHTTPGDRAKLGTFTWAVVQAPGHTFTVVNAYTQYDYRGAGVKADYEAIRRVFQAIKQQFSGRRIGYPLIGAGLARGDWPTISAIIDEVLAGENHTLVHFKP